VTTPLDVVFLLEVDNTLLDNDAVEQDLRRHVRKAFGTECQEHYGQIFEQRRTEPRYADYLGALQRYRMEHPRDPHLVEISLLTTVFVRQGHHARDPNVLAAYPAAGVTIECIGELADGDFAAVLP
jgi:hypothetical protein